MIIPFLSEAFLVFIAALIPKYQELIIFGEKVILLRILLTLDNTM